MENPRWRAAGVNKRANGAIGGDKGKDLESIDRLIFLTEKIASPWNGKRSDQKIRSDHNVHGHVS